MAKVQAHRKSCVCALLEAGILDCLHKHMDDVGADCKDAVLATSKADAGYSSTRTGISVLCQAITALNTVKAAATPAPQASKVRSQTLLHVPA